MKYCRNIRQHLKFVDASPPSASKAADELGRDQLGGAGEEGLGEELGERGGYGSGLGEWGGAV